MDMAIDNILGEGCRKGFIFDFDGTMVFNDSLHEKAFVEVLVSLIGREITNSEFVNEIFGKTNKVIFSHYNGEIRSFLGQPQVPFSDQELAHYADMKESRYRELASTDPSFKLVPGLADFLDKAVAKGVRCTIGSSAPKDNMDFYFSRFGLSKWFDRNAVVCDDGTVVNGKPHPEIFLKAAARLGLEPSECTVFEDSVHGIAAAKAAGAGDVIRISPDNDFVKVCEKF